jgi:amino acid adenylation domain-containing protein
LSIHPATAQRGWHEELLRIPEFPMSELKLDQGGIEVASTSIHAKTRNPLTGEGLVEQEVSFWGQKLAGIPAILELPTDRPRPPLQSFRAAHESMVLCGKLKQALDALSAQEGVSTFVVLCSAFQALLTRYTRQDDIVVGVDLTGQESHDDQEFNQPQCPGVPLRTDFGDDPPFRSLLARVNDGITAVREHQNVPWERVVEAVQPERDASRHPVFQVLFSCDDSPFVSESDLGMANPATGTAALEVDLRLQIWNRPDGLAAQFTYSTDLFDAATIARMAGHFRTLLEGIVENPDESVWRLPLLTSRERQQLVVEWNDTRMDYPRDRGVHQLFEAQVDRTPDAVAVVFGNESLTYRELDRRANQLAHHLQELGAKPDGLVGICLERGLDMVVGLLGILKAGSAYVPLDPAYPADRIAFMLEDAEAPLLITQLQLMESLPQGPFQPVLIDSQWPEIAKRSSDRPGQGFNPESRAYVIYTSGSTGKPKGVEIPHRAVVNFLTTMAERPGLTPDDRLLAVTTLCFDIAGLEMYLPLSRGASLEIVPREIASDGNRLLEKLNSSGATVMQATPATWRMLLEAGWTGDPKLKILIGGEAVSQKLATQLLERSGSVWNVYGPTETTIWSTTSELKLGWSAVTIGRPIGNTEIYILDKMLQPVPIGVAGELHIGGDGLARGYLKRPELTAEKFIPHPLSANPKARLYKTGDLVRYLPNGNIEFLGRIDHQVKIRGFRIELGEIETVLRQHLNISDTVVVAREDTPGDKRVVAYFVPARDAVLSTAELRSFLKEKLPEYMLPSVFVALKSMPLTPNGKVDRRALPAPDQSDLARSGTLAAPTDVVESRLVEIWQTVLGVRPIGVTDNYFELGGHSLVAVKLMNRIEEVFGKTLPIATLLQSPTIERLAVILRQKGAPTWSCLVPIQTAGSKPPFFCIHGANGAVVRFHALAQYLGPDQPFYGLQAQGLDPGSSCHMRTEEMASHYINEIRTVQPQGPYFLGGYSFGGAIAFEMAQQLASQGEPDTLVVLFDTVFPGPSVAQSNSSTWSAFLTFFRIPASQRSQYISRMITAPIRMVKRQVHVARLPRIVKQVRNACLRAQVEYTPQPYPGRVILFRSNHKPLGQLSDPRSGWSECAINGLEVHEIAGNHENILLEPQVRFVAEQLRACLAETQTRAVSSTSLEMVSR